MSVWLECRLEKEVIHMKRALIAVFGAAIVAVLAGVGSAQMGGSVDPGMMGQAWAWGPTGTVEAKAVPLLQVLDRPRPLQ